MANWETIEQIETSGLYRRVYHFSVQRPTAAMVPMYSTPWPSLDVSQIVEDGEGVTITKQPAQYAYLIDGAYVAAPDDALTVWRAEQEAAEFAAIAAKALPMVKQLRSLLAAFGLTIPTTEAAATEAIAQMDLTPDQIAALGALGVTWQAVQSMGIADKLEAILATEGGE